MQKAKTLSEQKYPPDTHASSVPYAPGIAGPINDVTPPTFTDETSLEYTDHNAPSGVSDYTKMVGTSATETHHVIPVHMPEGEETRVMSQETSTNNNHAATPNSPTRNSQPLHH